MSQAQIDLLFALKRNRDAAREYARRVETEEADELALRAERAFRVAEEKARGAS